MNKSKRNALMKHRKKAKKLEERQKAIAKQLGLPAQPKQQPRPKTEILKPVVEEKAQPVKKAPAKPRVEAEKKPKVEKPAAEKAAAPVEKKAAAPKKKAEETKAEKPAPKKKKE
jgi:hypothetical protein